MILYVDPIEAVWFLVNFFGVIVTAMAVIDASQQRSVARKIVNYRRPARLVVADGNLRRETLRLIVQALLLAVVIPSLFDARSIPLSPQIVALILAPTVLLISTLFDARDRRRLDGILRLEMAADVLAAKDAHSAGYAP